jgi:ABC-2 type transport system ATP-binding protein
VCARLNGLPVGEMEERMARAAERLGLAVESEAYLDELSRGQRRKVALALGFALERRLMILDEPTEALDESGRRALAQLCIERMKWGGSLLVASHDKTFLGAAQAHCLDLTSACM